MEPFDDALACFVSKIDQHIPTEDGVKIPHRCHVERIVQVQVFGRYETARIIPNAPPARYASQMTVAIFIRHVADGTILVKCIIGTPHHVQINICGHDFRWNPFMIFNHFTQNYGQGVGFLPQKSNPLTKYATGDVAIALCAA